MTWFYNGGEFSDIPEDYIGFVYSITQLDTDKKYVGKKLFWSKKTLPPLKGKNRKRRKIVESDWQDYFGSSELVKHLLLFLLIHLLLMLSKLRKNLYLTSHLFLSLYL